MKPMISLKKSTVLILSMVGIISSIIVSCDHSHKNVDLKMPSQEEAQAAIKEKIEMANEKWASGDPMGFVEVAANDITWMDDLGAQFPVCGKDSLTSYLGNFKGQIPPHQHELSEMGFQFYDDIVIITYRYTGTFDGVPADPWKVSSVYKYTDGDWLSVHENWSVVMNKE